MTREDFEQLQGLAHDFSIFPRIGAFSPIREGERKIFPKATALPRRRWDLNKPSSRRFDLLVASSVFMYAPDPARWFRHALGSCKYLLLLDLVRRRRGENGEFGTDGDCMRYAVGRERPRVEHHFNLHYLGDWLLAYRTFYGGANSFDDDPLHVVALLRGDLADPILRVDDYPTGFHPVLPDLTPLHEVLRKVEARGLRYYLGIVPALLTDEMFRSLSDLEHMVPAVHGYDHANPKYAPLLQAKGDRDGWRIVGRFDEFKGQPYHVILARLLEGRRLLQDRLGKVVDAYIPPCNIGNHPTGRALAEAGYRLYLSDRRIPGCPLSWMRSDFSGRSSDYDYSRLPEVVTLDLVREWDLMRRGDTHALDRLLDHLAERRQRERERGARLSAAVGRQVATSGREDEDKR